MTFQVWKIFLLLYYNVKKKPQNSHCKFNPKTKHHRANSWGCPPSLFLLLMLQNTIKDSAVCVHQIWLFTSNENNVHTSELSNVPPGPNTTKWTEGPQNAHIRHTMPTKWETPIPEGQEAKGGPHRFRAQECHWLISCHVSLLSRKSSGCYRIEMHVVSTVCRHSQVCFVPRTQFSSTLALIKRD